MAKINASCSYLRADAVSINRNDESMALLRMSIEKSRTTAVAEDRYGETKARLT